ncbi:phosphoribosylanthranilate isomerase [Cohnella sp. REN36]|uniref:phosphoribosylanthranilate isomerase n=1 Tax=Cohnella sp. REN36 TaxID=2887347 RepID=UPI001D1404CB|nr:phosphoribosylanthranilate isomerase [Cohnella sp. REN36]MCC3373527.1 phosphoribosylanthranilate isomerase [Cohnella sp. REN36]
MKSPDAPLVKICGIRDAATLLAMDGLPVDYIGFVFAESRRRVTPAQAAELLAAARQTRMSGGLPPRAVGVFVDPTMETLADTLGTVPLDAVQLHGKETPDFAREVRDRFGVEVWRALPVAEADEAGEDGCAGPSRLAAYRGAASAILLDTAGGGTGRTFRWDMIPAYRAQAEALGLRLFVAGGLHPGNVGELMEAYAPHGVDISSGVETDGTKDPAKIAAFTERVKRQP